MPIDPDYKSRLPKTGTHTAHDLWGEKVERQLDTGGYEEQIKKNIEKDGYLGVHGSIVAVDFDLCIADGACLPVCPVAVFEWIKNPGNSTKDGRLDEFDKSDPIREADCIFCMACETVCPTVAIKIYQP